MIGPRDLGWLAAGFAVATAVCAAIEARPAKAQGIGSFTTTTTIPGPRRTLEAARPRPQAIPSPPDEPVSARGAIAIPGTDRADPGAESGDDDEALGPRPRIARRAAPQDGDPEPAEAEPPRDGIVEVGEPVPLEDGADPTLVNAPDPQDVALIESPPAGFDPRLFDIELEPILDRRPASLFQFEPYDPKGIRVGSMILFPEAAIGASWHSNVFRAPSARSDIAYDVRPSARLLSNWRVHAFEFRASGLASHFQELSSENERAYTLEMRGRLDIAKRTSLEGLVLRDLAQESRSAIGADRSASQRADITTDKAAATLNHRFNRLTVQLRGSVTDVGYGDVTATDGSAISGEDRDYRTTEEAVRLRWELKPTLFGFVEHALNQRNYRLPALSDGIRRDSSGDRARVGVSFGNTSRKLRGEVSIGYGRQRPDDGRLREIEGIIVDANLAYRLSRLTTLLLTARSDVTETTLAGSAGALTHQLGAEVRHALYHHLIASADLGYTLHDYGGVDLDERELRTSLGLEHFVSREVMLFGRYQHTRFESTDLSRNYNADEVRVGMRIRQ